MSIACQELVKSYRGRRVVDHLSFTAGKGEVVGLLGPNGAGKTTTFYMVLGLVKPEEGAVLIDGHDVTTYSVSRRGRLGVGYLAQEPSVFRKLTVRENMMVYIEAAGIPARQRDSRAKELLTEFGIAERESTLAISLSGGERRRLEIARSLAAGPSYILLDEPFTGVDPIAIGEIKGIIRRLAEREIGVVITDHNVRETLSITDRAYIVSEGRIITSGTADTIPHDPLARKHYLGKDFEV